jgi:hypothetical protein
LLSKPGEKEKRNVSGLGTVGGTGALSDYAGCTGSIDSVDAFYCGVKPNGVMGYPSDFDSNPILVNGKYRWSNGMKFSKILDGLSNTIFMGEKHVRPEDYGTIAGGDISVYNDDLPDSIVRSLGRHLNAPSGCNSSPFPIAEGPQNDLINTNRRIQFGSMHPGLSQFVMGDGRVISVPTVVTDLDVLRRMASRNDGEVARFDF